MKRQRYASFMIIAACCGLFTASCGSEETTADNRTKEMERGLTFKIAVEEYETQNVSTRATQSRQPEVIDIGNGLVAEISVQPDTLSVASAPKTRAAMSDGHYKIYVLDAAGNRLTGVSKTLNGTMSGGTFIPDSNDRMLLGNGTYTFVCINDAVTDNGTSLSFTYGSINPMIGVTTKTLTQPDEEVNFTMKHLTARVRWEITSYTTPTVGAKVSFFSDCTSDLGGETFDLKGTSTGKLPGCLNKTDFPFSEITPVVFSPIVKPYTTTTDYIYYVDGTNMRYIQHVDLSGTLHGKNLNNVNISNFLNIPALGSLKKNHSYVVNCKIKTKDPLYLYQDGTVGYWGDKDSRTPIGVVVKEKTETTEGTAVAMKNAGNTQYEYTTPWGGSTMFSQCNTTFYAHNDVFNDMDGYKWTWEAAGTVDGRIKANYQADFTPYHAAGSYSPGVTVTGTNVGKWYLPALGEWAMAFKAIAGVTLSLSSGITYDRTKMEALFTAGGGEEFFSTSYGTSLVTYWSSTEEQGSMTEIIGFDGSGAISLNYNSKHNLTGRVRPFVHF